MWNGQSESRVHPVKMTSPPFSSSTTTASSERSATARKNIKIFIYLFIYFAFSSCCFAIDEAEFVRWASISVFDVISVQIDAFAVTGRRVALLRRERSVRIAGNDTAAYHARTLHPVFGSLHLTRCYSTRKNSIQNNQIN